MGKAAAGGVPTPAAPRGTTSRTRGTFVLPLDEVYVAPAVVVAEPPPVVAIPVPEHVPDLIAGPAEFVAKP